MMHGIKCDCSCVVCSDEKTRVILQKTAYEIEKVAYAAQILMQVFDYIGRFIKVGVSPSFLCDKIVKFARQAGAIMDHNQISFCRNGYVHPVVRIDNPLEHGEIFTLDIWLSWDGWYADLARPYLLGENREQQRLYSAALDAQKSLLEIIKPGNPYLTLVEAAQKSAKQYGCYVLEEACGHGIGKSLHEEPMVCFSYAGENLFSPIPINLALTIEVALSLEPCSLIQDVFGGLVSNTGETVLYAEAMVAINSLGNVKILGY